MPSSDSDLHLADRIAYALSEIRRLSKLTIEHETRLDRMSQKHSDSQPDPACAQCGRPASEHVHVKREHPDPSAPSVAICPRSVYEPEQ
jgi:hypothetical protein